jgi:membrane protease YdiL (CAAX protease family)
MRRQDHGWQFIDLASRGTNTPRSYAITLLTVVFGLIAFLSLAFTGIYLAAAAQWLPRAVVRPAVVEAAFGSVICAGLALAWSVAHIHRRPWMSLIAADLSLDWRRLAIGAGVQGMLLLAFLSLAHLVTGRPWRLAPAMLSPALAVVMLMIPFQAASEEMLFRGYLTQGLGRLLRSRVKIAVAVGVLFGALHFNAYGALTLPYLFGLSLIYSLVSLRDDRLELTIGAHAATNWFAVGAANALGASRAGIELSWSAIPVLMLNGALLYGITRVLVRRFCAR